jgi:hypothetical protein
MGHVDSAAGVGITASDVHEMAIRGLRGGRKFAVVEGHPEDNQRFSIQMSTVGASTADLTIFREMVAAWYDWHFDEERGASRTESDWLRLVNSDCWKLYPDIGDDTGVRNAIIRLIGEDMMEMWSSGERIESRSSKVLPSDKDLLRLLWKELGVAPLREAA